MAVVGPPYEMKLPKTRNSDNLLHVAPYHVTQAPELHIAGISGLGPRAM